MSWYPIYGPEFRWFAWRPAKTEDRGWRWLIWLYKRKVYSNPDYSHPLATSHFETHVVPVTDMSDAHG